MDTDDHVVTHQGEGRTEIIIQGTDEEDPVLHTVGGQRITLTRIGRGGSAPCQLETVTSRDKANCFNGRCELYV